ncbi:lipoate--protein ligase family protein [Gracilibacillus xinjiangensis]|uniref:Octanoyl-[GcvH]:protein N-octanoyltransferase n=1 Tax=Gracilibacillus xinjiangensis TaxID=1193282 RepID=A0ABV8WW36_9BACI
MKDWHHFFDGKEIRMIDHSDPAILGTAMASFAVDDTLCESIGRTDDTAAIRFWVHDHTVVLGILDSRLPNIAEAVAFLEKEGFDVVVRNSGGLAVVLDGGVLNFSLILPDSSEMGIHSGYELMTAFVQEMYHDVTDQIEAFEVAGSYCPGDYDLSIGGKKFAGISQRRVKNGIAVQIYLCIEGNGQARADFVRQFYLHGQAIKDTRFDYPVVDPETMRSLADLTGAPLTVADAKERVLALIGKWYELDITEEELPVFEKRMKQMVERNEKAFK